jgi:hypothetical protein
MKRHHPTEQRPLFASTRVVVPVGFSGWWCERCEKAVTLPDELGSPARCPRCHKPTAVWIPPLANAECGVRSAEQGPLLEPDEPTVTPANCRRYVTREQGASAFEQMKALIDDVEPYDEARAKQQGHSTTDEHG